MPSELQRISVLALDLERLSSIGEVLTIQIDLLEQPEVIKKELETTFNDPLGIGRYRDGMIFIDRSSSMHVSSYEETLQKLAYITGGLNNIDGIIAMIDIEYQGGRHPIVIELDVEHKAPQVISVFDQKEIINISRLVQTRWIMSKRLIK